MANQMVTSAIKQAKELEYDNAVIRDEIDANRQLLRLLDKTGNLSEKESAWLGDFYPLKGRGTSRNDDDVKRTRELKKSAREEIARERGEEVPTGVTE